MATLGAVFMALTFVIFLPMAFSPPGARLDPDSDRIRRWLNRSFAALLQPSRPPVGACLFARPEYRARLCYSGWRALPFAFGALLALSPQPEVREGTYL